MKKLVITILLILSINQLYANCIDNKIDSSNVDLGNDTSICEGSILVLSVDSGNYHFLWSTGDTTSFIVVSDSGYYAVQILNDSLKVLDSDTIFISINKKPNSKFDYQQIFQGECQFQIELFQPGCTYYWDFNNGEGYSLLSYPRYVYQFPTSNFAKLTLTSVVTGCKSTYSTAIYLYPWKVGINNIDYNLNKIFAAPNPFQRSTIISFELYKNEQKISIELYDILGRKVNTIVNQESKLKGQYEFPIELENENGLYILKLIVDEQVSTYKLLKSN